MAWAALVPRVSRRRPLPGVPENADDDPTPDDYKPGKATADTEAIKDLLLWARQQGISMQNVTVGEAQLLQVVDHFPRKSIQAMRAAQQASGEGQPAGEEDDMFSTAAEREILRQGG